MTRTELRASLLSEVSTLLDNDELMSEAIRILRSLRSRMRGYTPQEEGDYNNVVCEPACAYEAKTAGRKVRAKVVPEYVDGIMNEPEPDSKEYILKGLKEAFLELREIKAGRGKGRSARELLKELREEEEEEE